MRLRPAHGDQACCHPQGATPEGGSTKMRQNVTISFFISWLHFSIQPVFSPIRRFFRPIRIFGIARWLIGVL